MGVDGAPVNTVDGMRGRGRAEWCTECLLEMPHVSVPKRFPDGSIEVLHECEYCQAWYIAQPRGIRL